MSYLALQMILYFIQGIYMVLFGPELFSEDCEAWAHGPPFRDVYDVFKNLNIIPLMIHVFPCFKIDSVSYLIM